MNGGSASCPRYTRGLGNSGLWYISAYPNSPPISDSRTYSVRYIGLVRLSSPIFWVIRPISSAISFVGPGFGFGGSGSFAFAFVAGLLLRAGFSSSVAVSPLSSSDPFSELLSSSSSCFCLFVGFVADFFFDFLISFLGASVSSRMCLSNRSRLKMCSAALIRSSILNGMVRSSCGLSVISLFSNCSRVFRWNPSQNRQSNSDAPICCFARKAPAIRTNSRLYSLKVSKVVIFVRLHSSTSLSRSPRWYFDRCWPPSYSRSISVIKTS